MLETSGGRNSTPGPPLDKPLRDRPPAPAPVERVRLPDHIAGPPPAAASPLSLVVARSTGSDTIEINFRPGLPAAFLDALLAAQDGDPDRCQLRTPPDAPTLRKLTLHQPSFDAIRLIAEHRPWHQVARLHWRYDSLCRIPADARSVKAYIHKGLVQKWSGKKHINVVGDVDVGDDATYISADPSTPRNAIIYLKGPCCRIEIKYEDPKACRDRLGVKRIEDVTGIDPVDLFHRNFKFLALRDPAAFDADVERYLDAVARCRHRKALSTHRPERYAAWPKWAFQETLADHHKFLRGFIAHECKLYLKRDLPPRWSDLPIAFLRHVLPALTGFHAVEQRLSNIFF